MPDQRIRDEVVLPDRREIERHTDNVVLALIFREKWPWSVEEIGRELNDQTEASDAVCRLLGSGLVHRLGDLVFPTRAARRGAEIEIGT
jgi:hypothetical protein